MANSAQEAQRILFLNKKREREKEALEIQKQRLKEDSAKPKIGTISEKFARHQDVIEQEVREATTGLLTLDEIQKRKQEIEKQHIKEEQSAKKKSQKKKKTALSFDDGEEADNQDDEPTIKRPKVGKNPAVDTSFLPDRDREAMEAAEREKLKQEWLTEQEKLKNLEIDVTYSYWDGAGHRRTTRVKKGITVEKFLAIVQREFHELRGVSVENLMFIKEDLIIPHHYSFYDLIVTKARGKSGPLFHWDVHDDVRVVSDATVEKEESHAAKVVERKWYERNKHIFPASRWEVYDPNVKHDRYTIHGGEIQ